MHLQHVQHSLNAATDLCRNVPKLDETTLAEYMPALPAWELAPDKASVSRSFVAKNFVAAIDFFNGVKEVAESEGHHPDLHLTDYRRVQVVISTHAAGGLTMFDLILASKIDEIPVVYSPKWLRSQQVPEAG
jgi:4a-hydroxytetrahydrobiopterin dehydratase